MENTKMEINSKFDLDYAILCYQENEIKIDYLVNLISIKTEKYKLHISTLEFKGTDYQIDFQNSNLEDKVEYLEYVREQSNDCFDRLSKEFNTLKEMNDVYINSCQHNEELLETIKNYLDKENNYKNESLDKLQKLLETIKKAKEDIINLSKGETL